MKKYIKKSGVHLLCAVFIFFFLGTGQSISGQVLSNEALYANGHKTYNDANWQYAAVYLYALLQRNPDAFRTDPAFKKEVHEAYNHSIGKLNQQVVDLKNCRSQVASLTKRNDDDQGSTSAGLGTKPPRLRPPSTVRFVTSSVINNNDAVKGSASIQAIQAAPAVQTIQTAKTDTSKISSGKSKYVKQVKN